MTVTVGKCTVCSKETKTLCSGCKSTYYCSREHQKFDWKTHKGNCNPFSIEHDPVLGRHLVAKRDIQENEIVLKEKALVSGPLQTTGPVCLGCHNSLDAPDFTCPQCGWPMCSPECARSPNHRPECHWAQTKRKAKVKISQFVTPHPTYGCLMALRCCFIKPNDPDAWDKLMSLQSSGGEKHKKDDTREIFGIIQLIKKFYCLENEFSDQDIFKICGIIEINSHEVPLSSPAHTSIYWKGSFIEHSCFPNCSKSFTAQGELLIRAAKNIPAGEHISISYTDPLWGTPQRRHHLLETKYFSCNCQRCADPTEMGSYFSAVNCIGNKECKGLMLPKTFLDDMLKFNWVCSICKKESTSEEVLSLLAKISEALRKVKKDNMKQCQQFLQEYSGVLPKNHYFLTEIGMALAQLYGQVNVGGLQGLELEKLQHKEALCRQYVHLTETIIYAECRARGVLYFELHAAVAEKARRAAASGLLDPDEVRHQLMESKAYLEKCLNLLKYEPINLPEGKIYYQAQQNQLDLENLLRGLHLTMGDSPL